MNVPELTALLEQHEKRGLPWVSIKTEDFRALLACAATPAPVVASTTYTGYDADAIAACIRAWPSGPWPGCEIIESTIEWTSGVPK
jgi:hypothetical protein